jgi:hypothetical protein
MIYKNTVPVSLLSSSSLFYLDATHPLSRTLASKRTFLRFLLSFLFSLQLNLITLTFHTPKKLAHL